MTALTICCHFSGHLLAQTSLSLSSAVGSPNAVTSLGLSLQVSGRAPAALQFTLTYSPGQILAIVATAGPATGSAGKYLQCFSGVGLYKCLLIGLNSTPIGPGPVAYVQIVVAPNATNVPVGLSGVLGVDPAAASLGILANGSGTVIVPALSALACAPAVLSGGSSANCSVSMNAVVPAGGIPVTLSSDNPALSVPASVTVPAGQTSAGFAAVASPVTSAQTATVIGSWNGGSASSTLNLSPQASLLGLNCNPTSLGPAATTACTVSLTNPAPAGGYLIALAATSNDLTVPASVTMPSGSATVGFTARAGMVQSRENVTLTAALNGTLVAATLLLQPAALPMIGSLSPSAVAPGSPGFTLLVNGAAFLGDAVVQWNGAPLDTGFVNSGQLAAVVPAGLIANAGIAAITVFEPGGITSNAATFNIIGPPPSINTAGIVPFYGSGTSIEAGSWVSIFGNNLAGGTFLWNEDFPTSLGGTTVTVDGKPAYLMFVSPGQINIQAPDDNATGTVPVVVTTPSGTATSTVTLSQFAPSFFRFDTRYAAGAILTSDGSGAYANGTYDLLGPSGYFTFGTRPATAGDTLELYGVGFGPTNPPVPAGHSFTGAAPVSNPVTVTIGGVSAQVLFAGITSAGLYQLNIVVPAVGSGDQMLQANVGGVSTPTQVYVAIK